MEALTMTYLYQVRFETNGKATYAWLPARSIPDAIVEIKKLNPSAKITSVRCSGKAQS